MIESVELEPMKAAVVASVIVTMPLAPRLVPGGERYTPS